MSTKRSSLLSLKKNYPFIRKLYFFYNIYIRNYKFFFNSSQFGEEKKILDLFDNDYVGSYVDVGCFHPTRSNNTFKLYKKGWSGLNIDLNPLTIELFDFARPTDINICAAVSNKKIKKKLYFLGDLDSKNTLDLNHKNWINKHFKISNKDFNIKTVKTTTLNELLKKYDFHKIDFMNLDIEGHELEVLKSINFREFDIKVICVEILEYNRLAKRKKKQIFTYLKKNKYSLVGNSKINYIFKKKQ